jgi:nucleoside 2-deoxyribosyltransferase
MREENRVYLCGRINGCTDDECKTWRERAKLLLAKQEVTDPMRRDYRGIESMHVHDIIKSDKSDIDNSDVILVWIDEPSFGTAMEIMYAFNERKNIVVVNNIGKALSPWVIGHATKVFYTLESACEYIHNLPSLENVLGLFLKDAASGKPFARIDFQHWLNRKGLAVSDKQASDFLSSSNAVKSIEDGRWVAK